MIFLPMPKRAENMTQTSISIRKDILLKGKAMASDEDRSFSKWVERLIKEKIESEAVKAAFSETKDPRGS